MRTVPLLLATAVVLSTGPALAATKTSQDKPAAAMKSDAAASSSDKKYCLVRDSDDSTDSRIYSHECRTKADWAKRGLDVDQLAKQK
jgi:hypothetical protein